MNNFNRAGLNLIKEFEGKYNHAYYDCVGVLTIGYGHTNYDGWKFGPDAWISDERCDSLLLEDLQRYIQHVRNLGRNFTDNQFSALVSFCYNCGNGSLQTLCRNRNNAQIANALLLYNKGANGVVYPGLTRRRNMERQLFLSNEENPVLNGGSSASYSVPQPAYQTKFSALVQIGQMHANNFACGANRIAEDGLCGPSTKKARVKVLQQALNLDYGAGLAIDGDFGTKSKAALGNHYVRRGEQQYMVTALEILLYLNNYDPKGLENPGQFGPRLEEAVVAYQKDHHLSQDGIAGRNTFLSLLA